MTRRADLSAHSITSCRTSSRRYSTTGRACSSNRMSLETERGLITIAVTRERVRHLRKKVILKLRRTREDCTLPA